MAPIHDTDIAQERWNKSEWQHYELWEKVEHRLKRQKWIWIIAAAAFFLLLSSIPIIRDRSPKWISMSAARQLAQEINWLKRQAGIERAAFRIRFEAHGSLRYQIEKSNSCSEPARSVIRTGQLLKDNWLNGFTLMTRARGEELGIPGLVEHLCYDYLAGSEPVLNGEPMVGFTIMPVNDLAEKRMDRSSVVLVNGTSAEVTFE